MPLLTVLSADLPHVYYVQDHFLRYYVYFLWNSSLHLIFATGVFVASTVVYETSFLENMAEQPVIKKSLFDRFMGTIRLISNFGKEDRDHPDFSWYNSQAYAHHLHRISFKATGIPLLSH